MKIPDPPTSPPLKSFKGLCGRKAPCFLLFLPIPTSSTENKAKAAWKDKDRVKRKDGKGGNTDRSVQVSKENV